MAKYLFIMSKHIYHARTETTKGGGREGGRAEKKKKRMKKKINLKKLQKKEGLKIVNRF